MKIGVVGGGGWGTALAKTCADKGHEVIIWAKEPEVTDEINNNHSNETFLACVTLPNNLKASTSLEEVVKDKKYIISSVPSQWVRSVAKEMAPFVAKEAIIISASKGLEVSTLKKMSDVLQEELPQIDPDAIVTLSGPTHAEEVALGCPSTIVVATPSLKYAQEVQELLITDKFRVYTNPDRTGVQLGGSMKNVIALAAGICDGMELGDNAKAALLTRGLAEIARLGMAMGAKIPTFAGLSGIGDLFVTAGSRHSRNAWAGRELGKGRTLEEIIGSTKMVVEGVATTEAAYKLAKKLGVEMPITEVIYKVLYEGLSVMDGVKQLMTRDRTHEMEEVVSATYTWD